MTPLEVEWELSALAARRRMEVDRMDDLAWLAGRYAAIGVNAPKRYPRRPDGVKRKVSQMGAEDMKAVFLGMAGAN